MGNPLVDQGSLNRLRGSIVLDSLPTLNVTAPFLSPEGIGLVLEGAASDVIPTMTGTVISPQPYQMVTVTAHLLRTQSFADRWKSQQETDSRLGLITVRPDAKTLSPYLINNCTITQVGELVFNGQNAGYGVSFQGYWNINNTLWLEGI